MKYLSKSSLHPAVVLGGVGAALSITRSLGRAGIPVYVLGNAKQSLAGHSRYCTEFIDSAGRNDTEAHWLEWLETAPAGSVVIPCGDHGLSLVASHADQLADWGLIPIENAGRASLAMLDKQKTYEIARRAGIATPSTWPVSDYASLEAIADELTYPCALKPLHSHIFSRHFDVKLFVAANQAELFEMLGRALDLKLEMLVTEIIPGPDDRVWGYSTYLDNGKPLFQVTKRKLRQYPVHFGVGTYHLVTWDAEVAEIGLQFLQCANLRGMANVEFKRDERDESLKLIECNHRFMASNEVLRRAGVDVPLVAYRRALGQQVSVGSWRSGVRLWFPAQDVSAARDLRREGEVTWPKWILSLLRYPLYTPAMSLGDLRPSIVNAARRVRNKVRAMVSRP